MTGHVFVIHGDMRRLACDAVVVPSDNMPDVNPVWEDLLPRARVTPGDEGRLRVHADGPGPWFRLPPVDGREVHLLDTVSGVCAIDDLVSRTIESVDRIADSIERHDGRAQPLIALPLVGTGQGGLAHQRGAVVRSLVSRLVDQLRDATYDVALVLSDSRDLAAVQELRPQDSWDELSEDMVELAGVLGDKAARGELSLFLGSGVSVPVGLPTWFGLLAWLAGEAGMQVPRPEDIDYLAFADELRESLGHPRFEHLMQQKFEAPNYALSHGLLSGLGVRQIVTTNYDPCMETAMTGVRGNEGFRVMTRHLASGDLPWLLKLHGDIARPETLVLSGTDYDRLKGTGGALYGLVQGLMLTGHLLFVGFSLQDEDFLVLASAVQRVRHEAEEATDGTMPLAGTALALYDGTLPSAPWRGDLDIRPVSDVKDDRIAARTLEVFLDRLVWEADRRRELRAEYLLDERYDGGFNELADQALREGLRRLVRELPSEAGGSSGWPTLRDSLIKMGADGAWLERFESPL
jgi:hypothetical protein